ncbi:MAG: class I SAM-dependent methyltransferase [Bacteroidetes bacterium]|nr:class I SAM-dependent methyltransferase [Bacteroidota bacterium]
MTIAAHYIGNELELFGHAHNWKSYYRKKLIPFITGDVLEAGAGIGETTRHLFNENVTSWTCLEPDAALAAKIQEKLIRKELPEKCTLKIGTTNDYQAGPQFDSIIYIDVIEHIENDQEELLRASKLLRPGGYLVILVPAHQWLFSPFDEAIGHYRRYSKQRLKSAVPAGLQLQKINYMDCFGLFASLTNKLFLRKSYPTIQQVKFWDNYIVPVSKIADPFLFFSTGKSLIGVWKKQK